jgi:hypothetical protein
MSGDIHAWRQEAKRRNPKRVKAGRKSKAKGKRGEREGAGS